ncbi:TIGR04283 family arsenosugar biosynthesis glycosyltransferase [Cyanothece sp. BG0011]|uniref:TIGR04283 family arsenosugar biosynthesis glycosyltransferase n=1 Tax=Cyanothece sp. BG0011 TaxID=2082950 RepID=UPI000D1F6079|nr:TIGR04283 family arsenosugar biosynthesis glycosyltransferase [Cyanothece sp. BG0011]
MASLSIIIPTLNEEECLGRTLSCLSSLEPPAQEIIIVDGGSQDKTLSIADDYDITLITSSSQGRAIQMNQGARVATGDYLCFVHADTLVPVDLVTVIEKTLNHQHIACGGFISLMKGPQTTRWGTSLHNYLKTYYAPLLFRPHLFFFKGLRLLFGDQVMFCRRADFWQCGGFDSNLPIMEDADLCLKLVAYGKICLLNHVVESSDRRVAKLGALKANLIYLWIGILWGLGVSASYLKQFYAEIR